MADIRHLIDDAFYGAESIKLDVQNRIQTKEQRARQERLLEYQNKLLERARMITERAHRYEKATLEKNLFDIKARTISLEQMEGKRLSAKPQSSPVKLKSKKQYKRAKKRSYSLPEIHLSGGEVGFTIPEVDQLPRALTPGADLNQHVTYKDITVEENELNDCYVPLNENNEIYDKDPERLMNEFVEFPQPLPAIFSREEPLDHMDYHENMQLPTAANRNVVTKPPGPDSSFQQEKDFKTLRFSTRRYLTQADFISKSLDKVYERRFSRTLPPLSKASQEKLKMAEMVLGRGRDDDYVEEEPCKDTDSELESRPSVSDIRVIIGQTASIYHTEKSEGSVNYTRSGSSKGSL